MTDTITAIAGEGPGNSSSLVDLGNGGELVVDPTREPSAYLAVAGRSGLEVAYTVETHLHAEFVSGSREPRHLR